MSNMLYKVVNCVKMHVLWLLTAVQQSCQTAKYTTKYPKYTTYKHFYSYLVLITDKYTT